FVCPRRRWRPRRSSIRGSEPGSYDTQYNRLRGPRHGGFLMRRTLALLVALVAVPALADEPKLTPKPDAFPTLVNPNCSHCVDEAKRRAKELRDDDPVLMWTRGYSEGGAIPIRFFLSKHRVISDSYGVFVYDPDAGFARG